MISANLFLAVTALLSSLTAAVDQAVACAQANNKIHPRDINEADLTTVIYQTQTATLTLTVEETPPCDESPATTNSHSDAGEVTPSLSYSTFDTSETLTVTSTISSGTATLTTTVSNASTYNVPGPSTSATWSTSTTSASETDVATPSIDTAVTPFVPAPSSTTVTADGVSDASSSTESSTTDDSTGTPSSTDSVAPTVSAAAMPIMLSNDLMVALVAAAMVIAA
ncbi:uncharacterized protein QC761_124380 [Podospora bellae-mahoneyi]|uniref:Uncharacterized protein n=1 Tax=Podospora bellae-mahoneyi TaxID=2093777 RepID=A0ABR0FTN8_9PEZI|nr:hypothetical protein QC761_124380 [Podospora bellae-mahoneyi]